MELAELIRGLDAPRVVGDPGVEVADLAYDSRRVGPGTLFFCVVGERSDGHEFAPGAVEAGAAALVVERELELPVAQVLVADARAAMAPVAARFWGDPTDELRVVGVTGTNGKTTTAFLIREVLEAAGIRCGLLGTVKQVVGGVEEEVVRTTPEAIDLQATFRRMLEGGDRACAMEVSSHALALHRADAIHFEVALFTNLTQDHLDFHADMEEYFEAKRMLFEIGPRARDRQRRRSLRPPPRRGLRRRDLLGRRRRRRLLRPRRDLRRERRPVPASADVEVGTRLPGHFNVSNALAAFAAARTMGVEADAVAGALAAAERAARAVRADRGGPAVRRPRRLRPHPGLARQRAGGGAAADRRQVDLGVRRRRRPRPRQEAADGQRGGGRGRT